MDHYKEPMTGHAVQTCKVEIVGRDPEQEKGLAADPRLFQGIVQQDVTALKRDDGYAVTFIYRLAYFRPGKTDPMIEGKGTYVVHLPMETVLAGAQSWTLPIVHQALKDLLHQFAIEADPLPIMCPPPPMDDPDILEACEKIALEYNKIFPELSLS